MLPRKADVIIIGAGVIDSTREVVGYDKGTTFEGILTLMLPRPRRAPH
jgi:hypothetical protein